MPKIIEFLHHNWISLIGVFFSIVSLTLTYSLWKLNDTNTYKVSRAYLSFSGIVTWDDNGGVYIKIKNYGKTPANNYKYYYYPSDDINKKTDPWPGSSILINPDQENIMVINFDQNIKNLIGSPDKRLVVVLSYVDYRNISHKIINEFFVIKDHAGKITFNFDKSYESNPSLKEKGS